MQNSDVCERRMHVKDKRRIYSINVYFEINKSNRYRKFVSKTLVKCLQYEIYVPIMQSPRAFYIADITDISEYSEFVQSNRCRTLQNCTMLHSIVSITVRLRCPFQGILLIKLLCGSTLHITRNNVPIYSPVISLSQKSLSENRARQFELSGHLRCRLNCA